MKEDLGSIFLLGKTSDNFYVTFLLLNKRRLNKEHAKCIYIDIDKHAVPVLFLALSTANNR